MAKTLLSPKLDLIFKLIFGEKRNLSMLRSFLQTVLKLPAAEYEHLELSDPVLKPLSPEDKLCILDVKVYTRSGMIIDVEIQLLKTREMRERIVFYLSKLMTEQLEKGGKYTSIKKVASIIIMDYILIPDTAAYHTVFQWRDRTGSLLLTDIGEIHILELPKLPGESDGSGKWEWLSFIAAKDEKEMAMLAEKNPEIGKALYVLRKLSEDERTRMLAEAREKAEWDWSARIREARDEGLEEGKAEIVRNALRMKLPMETIMTLSGLTEEEIRRIGDAQQRLFF